MKHYWMDGWIGWVMGCLFRSTIFHSEPNLDLFIPMKLYQMDGWMDGWIMGCLLFRSTIFHGGQILTFLTNETLLNGWTYGWRGVYYLGVWFFIGTNLHLFDQWNFIKWMDGWMNEWWDASYLWVWFLTFHPWMGG